MSEEQQVADVSDVCREALATNGVQAHARIWRGQAKSQPQERRRIQLKRAMWSLHC